MKRLTLLTTISGGILIMIGILFVASTVGRTGGQDARMAGMLAMSFGGMAIAIPLYVEARHMQVKQSATASHKGRSGAAFRCSNCGMETAMFWCTTHTVRLCAVCVSKHDDHARCLYKSLVRTVAVKRA